jgi:hypothetical protein
MLNNKQREYVKYAYGLFNKDVLTKKELIQANKKFGCKYAPQWLIKNKDYKVDKATFRLPLDGDIKKTEVVKSTNDNVEIKKEAAYIVSSLNRRHCT